MIVAASFRGHDRQSERDESEGTRSTENGRVRVRVESVYL